MSRSPYFDVVCSLRRRHTRAGLTRSNRSTAASEFCFFLSANQPSTFLMCTHSGRSNYSFDYAPHSWLNLCVCIPAYLWCSRWLVVVRIVYVYLLLSVFFGRLVEKREENVCWRFPEKEDTTRIGQVIFAFVNTRSFIRSCQRSSKQTNTNKVEEYFVPTHPFSVAFLLPVFPRTFFRHFITYSVRSTSGNDDGPGAVTPGTRCCCASF